MINIAFFLNNPNLPDKSYAGILDGNPGIGGSEYEFLLVPLLLEGRDNGIQPTLLVNCDCEFPHKSVARVYDLKSCCQYCVDNEITQLVIDIKHFDRTVIEQLSDKLKILVWAHNNPSYKQLDLFWKLPNIKGIVNCGREEMELYRDHICSLKSTYVYNIFPVREKEFYLSKIGARNNYNVVYMGSIVKVKGFHVLAKAWKKVLKYIPDAQLYVIGTGRLYNSKAELGKYGIADKKYESLFMHHLTDSKGKVLPSVHFLGILGDEKYDILGNCKVGVPNPCGLSETFCICGIEMQLLGCNVTTICHPAYLDTISKKEWLYNRTSQLADYIIKRIESVPDDYNNLYRFITEKFDTVNSIKRWERLIQNEEIHMESISSCYFQHKRLKDKLLSLKIKYPLLRYLPCVEQFYLFCHTISAQYNRVADFIIRKMHE